VSATGRPGTADNAPAAGTDFKDGVPALEDDNEPQRFAACSPNAYSIAYTRLDFRLSEFLTFLLAPPPSLFSILLVFQQNNYVEQILLAYSN
jgi:hypothetical protein